MEDRDIEKEFLELQGLIEMNTDPEFLAFLQRMQEMLDFLESIDRINKCTRMPSE